MKKFLLALMASAAIFASCDDSQQLLSSAKITVPDTMEELFTNGVMLDASAQDIEVKFTPNSTWTIEFSCETPDGVNWVYADPMRGDGGDVEMTVHVTANESEMSRTATATVTCYSVTGDVTKSFTITQEGKKAAQTGGLTIDPAKVTVLKNEKFHLTAKDASGNTVKATWSSGDTRVARVDDNGDVQAINPGSISTDIYVTVRFIILWRIIKRDRLAPLPFLPINKVIADKAVRDIPRHDHD